MREKITFKEWLVNFFKGVWQALCWVGRAFNPKYKSIFGCICWGVITVCIVAVTFMIGKAWYHEFYERPYRYSDHQRISANLTFTQPSSGNKPGYIQNHQTGEVITKAIDWISLSADEDSLMVYSQKGKRGYINRYSGEISIPAKYDKAWVFAEGVAAVAEKDSVYFINHTGQPINGKKFRYNAKNRGYVYHGGHCAIAVDGGMMGLIDLDGEWAVSPDYDWIVSECNNFWKMRKSGRQTGLWYAFNDKAEQVTETGYPILEISEDLGIVATLPNHIQVAYGFDDTKSDKFLVRDIEEMTYNKPEWDENGDRQIGIATFMRYRMPDGHEGLCTVNGDIVTEPLYWEVKPIGKDTYLCTYKDTQAGVIMTLKEILLNNKTIRAMAIIEIREVSKAVKVEILGQIFNGMNDIKKAVEAYCRVDRQPWETEPKSPIDGIHVVCIYEPYPCFDSEDYANEDRDFSNYFFSTMPFTNQEIERLAKLPGRCNAQMVNENIPEWAVPAVYYRGEGDKMIIATL